MFLKLLFLYRNSKKCRLALFLEYDFLHGFLAQFINIKVMLYGVVSLSTFVLILVFFISY